MRLCGCLQASMFRGFGATGGEGDALGILELLAAVLLVLLVILVSAYFRLGLHKTTLLATVRQASQFVKCFGAVRGGQASTGLSLARNLPSPAIEALLKHYNLEAESWSYCPTTCLQGLLS